MQRRPASHSQAGKRYVPPEAVALCLALVGRIPNHDFPNNNSSRPAAMSHVVPFGIARLGLVWLLVD